MDLAQELEQLRLEARRRIAEAAEADALGELRVSLLGKKGKLTGVLRSLGSLPAEERPQAGQLANQAREEIERLLGERERVLMGEELERAVTSERLDVTLPGRKGPTGSRHLLSKIIEEVTDVFIGLGYRVAEGPEVELDYYNFTALNTPPGHPARSLQDTLYISAPGAGAEEVLLRTHTSPVQIRVMKSQRPPVYIVCPGRAFRRDVWDATHSPMFHQIEGLAVDRGITFADLKGTLEFFAHSIFGEDRRVRLRPHFFPFTEPSAEVDVSCLLCGGSGCRSCGGKGWLEILGAGMVDPNVLSEVGYDPEEYTGFAFGMGVERIAMLRHQVTDIRLFFENDVRFLSQFAESL